MKRLAIDAQKRNGSPDCKLRNAEKQKQREIRELVGDENQQPNDEQNDELAHGNRANDFILNIDKLWDKKLVHNRR